MACSGCAAGALHGGTPAGTTNKLYGLPCYVAEPSQEAKGVVVILTDAFGWELVNNRILADNIALKGSFRVLVPDCFDGHWLTHDLLDSVENATDAKQSWIFSRIPSALRAVMHFGPFMFFNRLSVTKPRVYDFFQQLRADTSLPVGAAGYCWGGKLVTLMCHGDHDPEAKTADGKTLIDAGYTAHPSFLAVPADAEGITLPYSVAHATKDHQLTEPEMAKFKAALEGKSDVEVIEYEGAKHGFAVRGNPNDETEKRQGMEAEEQAIKFFQKYLTSRSKL